MERESTGSVPRNPRKRRCDYIKADGKRCKNHVAHGKKKCYRHGKGAGPKEDNTNAVDPDKPFSTYFTAEDLVVMADRPEGPALFEMLQGMSFARLMRIQKINKARDEGDRSAGIERVGSEAFEEVFAEEGPAGTKKRRRKHTKSQKQLPDYLRAFDQMVARIAKLTLQREELEVNQLKTEMIQIMKTYKAAIQQLEDAQDAARA